MAFAVRRGSFVRYRATLNGRPKPAVVTLVTNQTTVNLKVGRASATVTGATKVLPHAGTVGWFHSGR